MMTHLRARRDLPETGAKMRPTPERFSDLPPSGLPEEPDKQRDERQHDPIREGHSALRQRLSVDTDTRRSAAACFVDR